MWTVASGQLPTGLTLSPSGTLSGTPTTTGSFAFTVQAGDSSSPSQTININVAIKSAPLLVIASAGGPLPDAIVGIPYSDTLLVTGGTPPYTWKLASGQLPGGLALSAAGVVSGTATTASSIPAAITLQVQDSGAPAQSKSLATAIRVDSALVITTPRSRTLARRRSLRPRRSPFACLHHWLSSREAARYRTPWPAWLIAPRSAQTAELRPPRSRWSAGHCPPE